MTHYADPPFDRPDAPFILRSSDAVDFKIHREILSVASPVFEGMFQIPQPIKDPRESATASETLPIIDVPEDSDTLDALFRLIYPTDRRRLATTEEVGKVLSASIKYHMDSATSQMVTLLKRFSRTSPIRTYAIACKLELEDVARLAVGRVVELRFRGRPSMMDGGDRRYREEMSTISSGECYLLELDQVSAGCYYRLLKFISPKTSGHDRETMKLVSPSGKPSPGALSSPLHQFDIGPWGNLPPDLIIRSSDGVELRAHRQMVSMASPVLEKIISGMNTDDISLPVLELDEHYPVLAKLLQSCYPVAYPDIGDMTSMKELLDAATKYRLNRVIEAARARLLQLKEVSVLPLRGYFLAIQYGWYAEARIFAAQDALCPPDLAQEYVPEMEFVSARAYKNLRTYRGKCKNIIPEAYRKGLLSTEVDAIIRAIANVSTAL